MSLLKISIADLNGVFHNPYACVRRPNEIIGAREPFKLRARFTAAGILRGSRYLDWYVERRSEWH